MLFLPVSLSVAYSLDEIEQMREFRKNQAPPVAEDASGFEVNYTMCSLPIVTVAC